MPAVYDFQDKIVVVTGAASGIGAALCHEFGRKGARIGLLDRDERQLAVQAARLEKAGVDAMGVACDVTSETACTEAFDRLQRRFGGIDVLVNNAGVTQRDAFVNTRTSVYRKVMDVNFFGAVHCTRAAIGSLLARRGMIIVTSSVAGFAPLLGRSGYCASKHALHGFFSTLRGELKPDGVHVMLVCPTFVKTNLQTRALGGDGAVTAHPQSRLGRQDSPAHIAKIVCRCAAKRRPLVVNSFLGHVTYWLTRIAPGIYETLMARSFRSEIQREQGRGESFLKGGGEQ